MIKYAFDLYPRTAPLTGDRLVRFTKLQSAEWRGEANGTGAGRFSIRASDAEAAFIEPTGMQYVRVVRIDTSDDSEAVVGGFFLEQGTYSALSTTSDKLLTFGGAGLLSYLSHAVMWSESYITGGEDPYDDQWRLYEAGTGNTLGAILTRVITEATHADRDQQPLNGVTLTFDYDEDSNGATWSQSSGNFTARTKENVLDVVRRLMEIGLYVEIDYDTFELSAYEPGTHRRDRTGSAWGTSVVRFQSPTDATVATGNIKTDATRSLLAVKRRSHLLVGAYDNYVAVGDVAVDIHWEDAYDFDAPEGDPQSAMFDAGHAQLDARGDSSDTLRLRMKLGDDPANGRYKPFESDGVLLDDLVTVHTGTGEWDWNEATFPVAALTVALRPGGDWDCWVDLGSTFSNTPSRQFQVGGAPVTGGPTLRLCDPTRAGTAPTIISSQSSNIASSGTGLKDFAVDVVAGQGVLVLVSSNSLDVTSVTWYPAGTPTGTTEAFVKKADVAAGVSVSAVEAWHLTPANAATGGLVRILMSGTGDKEVFAVAVMSSDAVPTATTGTGTGTAVSTAVTAGPADLVIDWMGWWKNVGTPSAATVGSGQTVVEQETFDGNPGVNDGEGAASKKVGASAMEWTLAASATWGHIVLVFDGSAGSNPLNGTSAYAGRCDKTEHEIASRAPTADDDTDAGYPRRTIWHDTASGATYISTDGSAGAAVWADIGGLGEAAIQALIDDSIDTHEGASDPHTGYQKESEKGAANGYASLGAGGLVPIAQLASGTPDGTKFVRDDGTLATPSGGGGGGSLTVEEVDGSPTDSAVTKLVFPNGTLGITSHVATYTPSGGGGGSLTRTTLGTTAVGSTYVNTAANTNYCKQITVASAGWMAAIYIAIRAQINGTAVEWKWGVWEDSAGTVGIVRTPNGGARQVLGPNGGTFPGYPQWYQLPVSGYLAAGTYWIGVALSQSNQIQFAAETTGGTDVTLPATSLWLADGRFYTQTVTTRDHSIYLEMAV